MMMKSMKQNRKSNHFIFPVFYKVYPSDVRNQRGSFSIEAKDGDEGSKWTEDNVKRWKRALTEVANLKGTVVSGYETIFIPIIVKKIHSDLGLKLYSTPTDLIGVEARAKHITTWLRSEQHEHPVLAICGMGGSGKTTLAKHIYDSNKQDFDGSSFLKDIENQRDGLLGVQRKLVHDISGNGNLMISDVGEGALQLEKVIKMNRVLIVVDDIDDKDQLNTLFGTKVFSTLSRIIITTRLLKIDAWHGSISQGCHVHEIELLNDHESLGLLSFHAFGSQIPMEGFEELAIKLAQYCEGNPLALKVLGSSLSEGEGTRIETWRSTLNSLNSLKGDLDKKIQGVLQKSFDTLPCDSHKELFLHIACFFLGEPAYIYKPILEDDYHGESRIPNLVNRCLLTLSKDGKILAMHKLLQDMARKIVRNESKDPTRHSRVWHHDECCSLLRKGEASDTIEGLQLNMMREFRQGIRPEPFKTTSLVKMKKLKYLKLDSVKLMGSYENFPELRWLRWRRCHLRAIPQGLLMSSLVVLEMHHGELEVFEPPMVLNSLKMLDLYWCYNLNSIRNFHRLPKLEFLNLYYCINLTHVCKTIGDLKYLSCLFMGGCTKLWKGSWSRMFVNQLERVFNYGGLPEQPLFSLPQSLSEWSVREYSLEILPHYINHKMLKYLHLSGCPNLKSLPCLPSTLKKLDVDWCISLENISFQSARFTLQEFKYDCCFKLCEIEGLLKLVPIAKLDEVDLGCMRWIKAYQDCKVDLVGDVITKGKNFNIQMLYEYGIRSVYLQGIKDQSMTTHEYTSSSEFLSFRVPSHTKKHMIKGLNVTFLYRSGKYGYIITLFVRIRNITKGVTWVYNPAVFCEPEFVTDVVWLSYWPIKNIDAGDEFDVMMIVDDGVIVKECGASLVYIDNGEVELEENCERTKEVIEGDLSQFEVTKEGYYLCRYNFFNSVIPHWFFGYNIQITDSRRWRKFHYFTHPQMKLNNYRNPYLQGIDIVLRVSINSEFNKIKNVLSNLEGVMRVSADKTLGRLSVSGRVDPQTVATCIREFDKMVQIIDVCEVNNRRFQDLDINYLENFLDLYISPL
ncbi:hypothetical protein QVD17_03245 [Tagetes erecta]|uniref:TIR domain-containing protein n=1 Tax=Tagetes erecta TaxID=13708 RepID=A0AAD8LAY4_TARER|nr:hypothetical protein QVD17_03245 [Tagetes erecta]